MKLPLSFSDSLKSDRELSFVVSQEFLVQILAERCFQSAEDHRDKGDLLFHTKDIKGKVRLLPSSFSRHYPSRKIQS